MASWEDFKRTHCKFSNIDIDAVKTLLSSVRGGVGCDVADEFGSGVDNVAFKVLFMDGMRWICRIHGEDESHSKHYTTARIESTVATMHYVKGSSSIPVPEIYAHESRNSTPGLGAGYIIMEEMHGQEVDMTPNALSPTEETEVYLQVAQVSWQLSQLRLSKIGRIYESAGGDFSVGPFVDEQGVSHGPFDSSVDFFKYQAESIRKRHDEWLNSSPTATFDDIERSQTVCTLYSNVATKLLDYDSGVFPLSHGDLGTHNMLFSRDAGGKFLLTGVLDWDAAHSSSWSDFGQYPVLLEIRWPAFEAGRYAPFVLESIRRKQRAYFQGLRHCETQYSNDTPHNHQLTKIVDSPAVRVAQFFLMYSDPEFNVDSQLLLKYVRAWKEDWECAKRPTKSG
jgi:aminoglycoside phosphotransferase (APT) family kinase protein